MFKRFIGALAFVMLLSITGCGWWKDKPEMVTISKTEHENLKAQASKVPGLEQSNKTLQGKVTELEKRPAIEVADTKDVEEMVKKYCGPKPQASVRRVVHTPRQTQMVPPPGPALPAPNGQADWLRSGEVCRLLSDGSAYLKTTPGVIIPRGQVIATEPQDPRPYGYFVQRMAKQSTEDCNQWRNRAASIYVVR